MKSVRTLILVAVIALFASVLPLQPAAAQGAPGITNCSLSSGEGGITATWDALNVPIDFYVYRIETDGNPDRYGQSNEPSAFIEVAGTAQIFVGAFITGVGYTPAVDCGTATGGPDTPTPQPTCSVASVTGGLQATFTEVDGADQYVWRLEIAGQSNRYNRASGSPTLVPVPTGVTGTVFVSAVMRDGSYTPAIACGSAAGGDGGVDNSPTCSVESTTGGVRATWSAVDGSVRYVYRYTRSDQPGVNRYRSAPGLGDTIDAPAGVSVTAFVSGQRADGSYTGAVPCGTATAGGGGDPTEFPSDCTFEWFPDASTTLAFQWSAVPDASAYQISIAGQAFRVGGNQTFLQRNIDANLFNLPTTASIQTEYNNQAPTPPATCRVVNAPATTLPALDASQCVVTPDADGQDITIEFTQSSADVTPFIVVRRSEFGAPPALFGSSPGQSPTRSAGDPFTQVSYQERSGNAATPYLTCRTAFPGN